MTEPDDWWLHVSCRGHATPDLWFPPKAVAS